MNTDHKIPAPKVVYRNKAGLRREEPARIWLRISVAAAIVVGIITTIYCTVDKVEVIKTGTFAHTKVETAAVSQTNVETTTRAEANTEVTTRAQTKAESVNSTNHDSHISKTQPAGRSNKQSQAKVATVEDKSTKAEPVVELALANETATASTDTNTPTISQESPARTIILIIIRPKPEEVGQKESPKKSIAKLVEGKIKEQASNVLGSIKTDLAERAKIVPELWASINIPGIKHKN